MGIYALRQALRERLASRGEKDGRLNESDREWIADLVDKKDTPEGNPDVRAIPYCCIIETDESEDEMAYEEFEEFFEAMSYLRSQAESTNVNYIHIRTIDGWNMDFYREGTMDDEYPDVDMGDGFKDIEGWIQREKVKYVQRKIWPDEIDKEIEEMNLLCGASYDEDDEDAVDEPLPDWCVDNEGRMPESMQRDKMKSDVPCLDLQYSFSAQTDDIWEDAFHTMFHCDIYRDENKNYYGNCLDRPGERRKIGEVELEILNWKRAVKYIGSTWSTAGLCRDSVNGIVELFMDGKGHIKKEFVKEFELCESKNILYVHDMQLIGECRGKSWGKYVLKSILETFDGMFGIMVIDANADHYAYMKGEYQEPGLKYPLELDERTLWDEQKEATIKLVRYYMSLGFKTFDNPLKSPYGFVDSIMWLNSGRANKEMEDVDIHVYWDY